MKRIGRVLTLVLAMLLALQACAPVPAASPTAAPAAKPTAVPAPTTASAKAAATALPAKPAAEAKPTTPAKPTPADAGGFYAGKTVKVVVPFAPGGGVDVTARLLASLWGEHIPGKPTVIVENMAGGGGSLAVRDVAERRAADGLSAVFTNGGVMVRWLLKEQGHTYPLEKMLPVGGLPTGVVTLVRTDAGDTLEKLVSRSQPLMSGHTAPGGIAQLSDLLAFRLLGVPVQQVYGYSGYGEVALALERGEVQATTPGANGYTQTWGTITGSNIAKAQFQSGIIESDGKIARNPVLPPEIPTVNEQYKRLRGQEPSGVLWDAQLTLLGVATSMPLLHPNTPPDRVAALRAGFDAMVNDPRWGPESTRVLGERVPTVDFRATESALRLLREVPAATFDVLKQGSQPN